MYSFITTHTWGCLTKTLTDCLLTDCLLRTLYDSLEAEDDVRHVLDGWLALGDVPRPRFLLEGWSRKSDDELRTQAGQLRRV